MERSLIIFSDDDDVDVDLINFLFEGASVMALNYMECKRATGLRLFEIFMKFLINQELLVDWKMYISFFIKIVQDIKLVKI